MVGAENDHIRLDAAAAELLDGVLRRLGLQLTGCGELGEKGDVDVERISTSNIFLELANRLNKWE